MRLTKSPCHVPERLKCFKRSLFLLDTCIDILKWRKIFVLDVSLRETKVYNGEVSLFLLFSFSRKIKWKKKRRKLWKFCLTWNSEKDEIQLTISCARTRCWWSMQLYGRRNTFIIMQCNGGGVRIARTILEFFEILIPLLLLLSTYYDGFVHSKCMKTQ